MLLSADWVSFWVMGFTNVVRTDKKIVIKEKFLNILLMKMRNKINIEFFLLI